MLGADSIVGVGAVVTERTEIRLHMLVVELPARAKRGLIDEEVARNRVNAEHYVENARRFREGGK